MIDPGLRESLIGFDEAALAVLANAGLVRRAKADLEAGKVALRLAEPGRAEVEADGQLVAIDNRGPKFATCACMAPGVCRHRIAAVLLLCQAENAGEGAAPPVAEDADPRAIVEALDPEKLQKWAGKPNWRAAIELLGEAGDVSAESNAVLVAFAGEDVPVRILRGAGFDGIVSGAAKTRAKALHAAAVLAARRHFRLALPDLEVPVETAAVAAPVDPEFLARIVAALGEVVRIGFNLAPVPLEESLFELSVSSRADALPRLAAILRAIAAQVRLRRRRSVDHDPDRMLELAATAFALTRAIATDSGERRIVLAGKVRRDFAPAPPLSLIGVGGERWSTTTGARGVTAWFCETENVRWLSTTLARGSGQDPSFMPGQAWRQLSMWQCAPLAELTCAAFTLEGANISAEGRLSAPAAARASITAAKVRPGSELVVSDWSDLAAAYRQQTGIGLDAETGAAACLLAPSAVAVPFFDDLAQRLVWPVRDRGGAWLGLEIDNEEPVALAIMALEAIIKDNWRGMVLVKLGREGDTLRATPLTLLGDGDPVNLTMWNPPWNWQNNTTSWFDRLRLRATRRFAREARTGTQAALASTWRLLLDHVEAGSGGAAYLKDRLAAQASKLNGYGLPTLSARLEGASSAENLLAAAWAVMLARQQRLAAPLLV